MPYLIEFLLFLLPFAAYALWRWLNPGIEPGRAVILAAVVGGAADVPLRGLVRPLGLDAAA